MRLHHIDLSQLSISATNMRAGKRPPDLSDILPSVRARGVLVPLLVRLKTGPEPVEGGSADSFEIVAGRRRFHAAQAVAGEGGSADPLPCAILDDGDDAAALEASMIENFARADPDEVTRWETFTRLVRAGRSAEDIAATFGLTDLGVRRILALGNLLPRIRDLYRKEEIDAGTVRQLTLASKSQQKAWLALHDDADAYCPSGHRLKAWLFGGASIAERHALFDLASYPGQIVSDLFGEERLFADAEQFWGAQDAAIETRRAAYIEAGWADVVIVGPGEHFSPWDYAQTAKRKGGRVYVDVRASGEVAFHEGYLSNREARRLARGEVVAPLDKPKRPEVTSTMQTYIDLHRHAAVRAALTGLPHVALRLMVAHAIAGSPLWTVRREPQASRNAATAESVEGSVAEAAFDQRRRAVLDLLGFDPEAPTVVGDNSDDYGLTGLFVRLLDLPEPALLDVVAIVMGETLASGSAAVEAVGLHIGVDMAATWQADDAFFDLIRDREVLTAIVAEVAGEAIASANAADKAKTMKIVVRDHLAGANGRSKVDGWVPRWMAFPPSSYTVRGGVGTVSAYAKVAGLLTPEDGPQSTEGAAAADSMPVADEPRALAA